MLAAEGVMVSRAGRQLLAGVDIEVRPGRLLAIVGPNGAGKTTLLRVLAGDLTPQAGTVTLDAQVLGSWARPALARRTKLHDFYRDQDVNRGHGQRLENRRLCTRIRHHQRDLCAHSVSHRQAAWRVGVYAHAAAG